MANPIIFIPGIEATTLVNVNSLNFDSVWDKYDTLLNSIGTPVFSYGLQMNPMFDEDNSTIIKRGHIDRFPYQDVINTLQAKVNAPIYLFGYDWRLPSVENGKRLLAFVAYLKNKLNRDPATPVVTKFDFLTHSMGGLVFSCYLKQLNGIYNDIGHIAMCACPFKGSVYALVHLAIGNAGVNSIFNANDASRKANRTFPAIFELCPWYDGSVTFQSDGSQADLTVINDWQSNVYDDNEPLFQNRLGLLSSFRNGDLMQLDTLPDAIKQNLLIVVGEGEDTHHKVVIDANSPEGSVTNFFDFDQPLGDGDGTVPIESSTFYSSNLLTIAVKKSIWNIANDMSYHGLFLKDSRVQNIINRLFTNQTASANWWASIGGAERKV